MPKRLINRSLAYLIYYFLIKIFNIDKSNSISFKINKKYMRLWDLCLIKINSNKINNYNPNN